MSLLARIPASSREKIALQFCHSFSSKSEGATSSSGFVSQRNAYRKQLTQLRKEWSADFDERRKKEEAAAAEALEKLTLEKAVRLRAKRAQAAETQEAIKAARKRSMKAYQAHLVKRHKEKRLRDAQQQKREAALREDYEIEAKHWVTKENLDSKICPALFEIPATTGLSTRYSELWRWQLLTTQTKREMSPELKSQFGASSLKERLNLRAQARSQRHLILHDMIKPMVGSGEERARYGELVDELEEHLADLEAEDDLDEYFAGIASEQQASGQRAAGGSTSDDVLYEDWGGRGGAGGGGGNGPGSSSGSQAD
jgi:hypothetical protein